MPSFLSTVQDATWFADADHRHLVPRTRQLQQLESYKHLPVRALIAPNGSGKTTLLQQYHHQHPDSVWVSLQPEDRDACHFFTHLNRAIEQQQPSVTGAILCNEFGEQAPLLCLDLFQHQLDRRESGLCILLDDMQVLEGAPWLPEFVAFMGQSRNINWIISGQSHSLLGNADSQHRANAFVMTHEDLYFTHQEIRVFLSKHANHQEFNERIMSITAGWPAGVKLGQLCLSRFPSFIVHEEQTGRELFFSMVDRLIDDLSPQAQKLLTQTAFLQRFNTDLGGYCVRGMNTERVIEELLETRFLLSINPEHPLRYHLPPMVSARAMMRFRQLDTNSQDQLIGRACTWLTQANLRIDGCKAAHCYSQPNFLQEYFLKSLAFWLRVGDLQSLSESFTLLDNGYLPQELAQQIPVRTARCWLMAISGRLKEAKSTLDALLGTLTPNQVLTEPKNSTEANYAVIYALIQHQRSALTAKELSQLKLLIKHPQMYTSLRTSLNCIIGEIELNRRHTGHAADYLLQSTSLANQLHYECVLGVSSQAEIRQRYLSGETELAMQLSETFNSRHDPFPDHVGNAMGKAVYAYLVYRQKNKLQGYEQSLALMGKASPWLHTDAQFLAYQPLIRYTIEQGDTELATALLQHLQAVANLSDAPRFVAQIALERFRLAIIDNQQAELLKLAVEFDLATRISACLAQPSRLDWVCRESWLLCGIFYELGKSDIHRASELTKQLLHLNVEFGYASRHLPLSLLAAMLEFRLDLKTAAYVKLNDVLTQAESEGITHGLFDDVPGIEVMVNQALAENRINHSEHIASLLSLGFG
ncbi:AAA family ATPase [Ketobacter alkanivorans]|uniref:ORC1/DEAH AAA+ ATPase domain-containing protein n=1 Tax=Ketobacter alkanivorans TaxID=1917421 RepID=A0A2K9LR32_9GAMM|nr:AAA family ATPase [Ketobacter alkanivorans]AUM14753.1 hypothetical protein Kalk_20995 [Ketobacter alkanivorans]